MKQSDWNQGLNHIDPDLVEEFIEKSDRLKRRKKRGILWLRAGVIAACLGILVASLLAIVSLLRPVPPSCVPPSGESEGTKPWPDSPATQPDTPTAPLQTPSAAPFYYGSEDSIDGSGGISGDAEIDFNGLSITARWKETLPDTYRFFDDWKQTEFCLIRMETVTLLKGTKMTDEFYYIIPSEYMTDFSVYDTFVISNAGQFAYEISVLFNVTDCCAEALNLPILGGSVDTFGYRYIGSNLMAFDENGFLDLRLWQSTPKWVSSTSYAMSHYDGTHTQAEAEDEAAQPYFGQAYYGVHMYLLENITGQAAQVLADIKSFENGIFVPHLSQKIGLDPEVQFPTTRYINGFPTNEYIYIYDRTWSSAPEDIVKRSTAQFTEDDMDKLPDLPSAVSSVTGTFESGDIVPPHIQNREVLNLHSSSISAWYAKTDDGVIGVIRINWRYESDREFPNDYDYFDDAYYVIEYGADAATPIDRDDLLARIGNCESTYIYKGDYDATGKVNVPVMPLY